MDKVIKTNLVFMDGLDKIPDFTVRDVKDIFPKIRVFFTGLEAWIIILPKIRTIGLVKYLS